MITFIIGDQKKKFIVHKEVACFHSEVLARAFNSGFIEGQTQTYTLDDVSEGAFKLFVQYLYHQEIELRTLASDYDETTEKLLSR